MGRVNSSYRIVKVLPLCDLGLENSHQRSAVSSGHPPHGSLRGNDSDRSNLTVVGSVVVGYNGEIAALLVVARNDANGINELIGTDTRNFPMKPSPFPWVIYWGE